MTRVLRMPEVAANTTTAVVSEWRVAVNGSFSAEDPIATIETDKAVVDVAADADGVLLEILAEPGAEVEVGAPIALLGDRGETARPPDPRPAPSEASRPPMDGQRVFISPLARRLAREAGLAVEQITGSGPGGRIVRRDVEAAVAGRGGEPTPAAPRPRAPDPPGGGVAYADEPHTRVRRAIAARLSESKQQVPHFYLRGTARVDRLLDLRSELNATAGPDAARVSLNDLVVKAAAVSHVLVPGMNAIWLPEAVRRFSAADIAIAVATDGGLVTPVLRAVDQLTISTVAGQTAELVRRARAGQLRPDELEGGALTVTNLGMYGTEEFAAIINPPQSAILAVGAVRQEPVAVDSALAVGSVLRVTLSVDHRVVDGALAAEWLRSFLSLMERPVRILA
jgi:pyruvate dehydrogenase E2 component (dihydrolipoamide acetyltransferase)